MQCATAFIKRNVNGINKGKYEFEADKSEVDYFTG